jgi:hypothetical protein
MVLRARLQQQCKGVSHLEQQPVTGFPCRFSSDPTAHPIVILAEFEKDNIKAKAFHITSESG